MFSLAAFHAATTASSSARPLLQPCAVRPADATTPDQRFQLTQKSHTYWRVLKAASEVSVSMTRYTQRARERQAVRGAKTPRDSQVRVRAQSGGRAASLSCL